MFPAGQGKKPGYRSVVLDYLRKVLTYRLTLTGKYLSVLGVVLTLASGFIFYSTFLIYSLIFFLFFIFALNPLLTWLSNPGLKAEISIPRRAAAGTVLFQDVEVENPSGRGACLVLLREEDPPVPVQPLERPGVLIPFLGPGEKLPVRMGFRLAGRGSYSLQALRVESSFPLGIVNTGRVFRKPRHLLVYPFFTPLSALSIPAGRKLQPGGIALASNVGESTEFLGTREFRDGDDPRYIHWSSWARLNKPVIKEFQEEYYVRIALLLDSYVPAGSTPGAYRDFEALLSLGASISDYLERQEYIIDIIAAGPQIYYLQAGRSLASLDQILDIMACLDVCREKPYRDLEPVLMEELSRISTVIALFLDVDEERQEFLGRIREMGIDTRVFVVNSGGGPAGAASLPPELFGPVKVLSAEEIEEGLDEL
jgi:uncharacterized protein (DUF58 family)